MITSGEMARRIAKRRKIPVTVVQSVLVGFADEITASMYRSEDVTLWGIGRFKRKCFKANCTTLTKGTVPMIKNGISFVAGDRIKRKLREGMSIFDEVEAL